jgi:predicted nucleic acid-binding protein
VTYLLDTNVVSEWRKRNPDSGVVSWFASVNEADLHVSVLTLGEIMRGVDKLRRRQDERQAEQLAEWLVTVQRQFARRVVPIGAEAALQWGRFDPTRPVPTVDGLLAATAIVRGLTLVTRNVRDVEPTGVTVLDPFTS